jgi:putative transposase
MLGVTRDLYNALLEQRRDCWKSRQIRITTKQQYSEITDLRKDDARCAAVYRKRQDAVPHSLDLAMQAFFRHVKSGEAPGYRRFKPAARWKQIEFPHGNRALKFDAVQKRVRIPGRKRAAARAARFPPSAARSCWRRTGAGGRPLSARANRRPCLRPVRPLGSTVAFTFLRP